MQSKPTARFCGNCGVQLFGPAFAAGQCLSCGFPITDTVTAAEAQAIAAHYQQGTPTPFTNPIAEHELPTDERLTQPTTYVGGPPDRQPPRRRLGLWLLFPLFLIVFLILFAVWHAAQVPSTTAARAPMGATSTTVAATAPVTGATTVPGMTAPPATTPVPGSTTPAGQSTPAPGQTPSTNPTATIAPNAPPSLAVSNITYSQTICLNGSLAFTVTNSGGGLLVYQVKGTSLVPYTINPTTGSLPKGQSDAIHVTGITTMGVVTVSATGVASQTITINCTL